MRVNVNVDIIRPFKRSNDAKRLNDAKSRYNPFKEGVITLFKIAL